MGRQSVKCSIIMPVKNGSQYIENSVQSVLAQDFSDWELIIVNDASTDATQEQVRRFLSDTRIRYISCAQSVGVSRARNIGLEEAKGNYAIFLDCDDCLLEDSVKNRIDELEEHRAEFGFFRSFRCKDNVTYEKIPQDINARGGGIFK